MKKSIENESELDDALDQFLEINFSLALVNRIEHGVTRFLRHHKIIDHRIVVTTYLTLT